KTRAGARRARAQLPDSTGKRLTMPIQPLSQGVCGDNDSSCTSIGRTPRGGAADSSLAKTSGSALSPPGRRATMGSNRAARRFSRPEPDPTEDPMPSPAFDRSRLRIQPLADREHDLDLSVVLPLDAPLPPFEHPALPVLGRRLVEARQRLVGARILV